MLAPGLRVLFSGINPGLWSAAVGHDFARPGNRFWKALHLAGFTPANSPPTRRPCSSASGLGITNLVDRATTTAAALTPRSSAPAPNAWPPRSRGPRPAAVAILGVGAYRTAFAAPKATLGPQPTPIAAAPAWVLPNPSGLNAHYQLPALAAAFAVLRRSLD